MAYRAAAATIQGSSVNLMSRAGNREGEVEAVRDGGARRRQVIAIALTVAWFLFGVLLPGHAGWSALVSASDDFSNAATPIHPTSSPEVEETPLAAGSQTPGTTPTAAADADDLLGTPTAEPEVTSTPESQPKVLTAASNCLADSRISGTLSLKPSDSPVTVTGILAVLSSELHTPVELAEALPVTLSPESASLAWSLNPNSISADVTTLSTLLIRLDELPGEEAANAIANDGRDGWHLVEIVAEGSCPEPTATEETDQEPVASPEPEAVDATPESMAEPSPAPTEELPVTPDTTPVRYEIEPETGETVPAGNPVAIIDAGPAIATPESEAVHGDATPAPESTTSLAPASIEITGRSPDVSLQPGETARYRFRVTNTTDRVVLVRLATSETSEGWSSSIVDIEGSDVLPEEIVIAAGETVYVTVSVYAPAEARPGSQNTTTLFAADVRAFDES
jgi:hypothetical protein